MFNLLLVCGTGASSGFMAKNIRKAAKEENLEINVKARSDSEIEEYIDSIDLYDKKIRKEQKSCF